MAFTTWRPRQQAWLLLVAITVITTMSGSGVLRTYWHSTTACLVARITFITTRNRGETTSTFPFRSTLTILGEGTTTCYFPRISPRYPQKYLESFYAGAFAFEGKEWVFLESKGCLPLKNSNLTKGDVEGDLCDGGGVGEEGRGTDESDGAEDGGKGKDSRGSRKRSKRRRDIVMNDNRASAAEGEAVGDEAADDDAFLNYKRSEESTDSDRQMGLPPINRPPWPLGRGFGVGGSGGTGGYGGPDESWWRSETQIEYVTRERSRRPWAILEVPGEELSRVYLRNFQGGSLTTIYQAAPVKPDAPTNDVSRRTLNFSKRTFYEIYRAGRTTDAMPWDYNLERFLRSHQLALHVHYLIPPSLVYANFEEFIWRRELQEGALGNNIAERWSYRMTGGRLQNMRVILNDPRNLYDADPRLAQLRELLITRGTDWAGAAYFPQEGDGTLAEKMQWEKDQYEQRREQIELFFVRPGNDASYHIQEIFDEQGRYQEPSTRFMKAFPWSTTMTRREAEALCQMKYAEESEAVLEKLSNALMDSRPIFNVWFVKRAQDVVFQAVCDAIAYYDRGLFDDVLFMPEGETGP
ncbi:MAG: hypothetical protein M1831_000946 [Alyxoria varia]|nr:MAG: hypothetical protein M1831_000946 [Alyxoria varia]